MLKESEIKTIVRFLDGKYLGAFNTKVDKMSDALKLTGNWSKRVLFPNPGHLLNTEPYEIKTIKVDIQLLD